MQKTSTRVPSFDLSSSILSKHFLLTLIEPPRDKTDKMACAPSEDRSAWTSAQSDQSSLSTWRKLGSSDTHWAHSEDSDQTGRSLRWAHMPYCWFCNEVAQFCLVKISNLSAEKHKIFRQRLHLNQNYTFWFLNSDEIWCNNNLL